MIRMSLGLLFASVSFLQFTAVGGGGPDLVAIHSMDFEDSTALLCQDGGSTDTCNVVFDVALATPPLPDCELGDNGNCPLADTFSGLLTLNNSYFTSTTVTTGAQIGTLDFRYFAIEGSGLGLSTVASTRNNGTAQCLFRINDSDDGGTPDTATCNVETNPGANVAGLTPFACSMEVDYYVRLIHDRDADTCELFVSTSAYGASDVGTSIATVTAGSSLGDYNGWNVRALFNGVGGIVDEIVMCDGDAGSTEGQCDTN
jgi:hypothetical protein